MSKIMDAFKRHQRKHSPSIQPQPAIQPRTQNHQDHGFNSWATRQRNQQENAEIELASKVCQECLHYPCICWKQ